MPNIKLNHISVQLVDPESGKLPLKLNGLDREAEETLRYLQEVDQPLEAPDRALALDDVSLSIRNGETLCIIGPSGCGKSTLLRVIAGLIEPRHGEVIFDGVNLDQIPKQDRGIGMMFQSYALFPHFKAQQNIGFFDTIRKREDRIPERIRFISEEMQVPVKHLLGKKPPQLSGGERQRVALAHCLARDPQLFLFDEPLSNLDAKLRTSLRAQLKKVIHRYQITAVYVTHDQVEAISLGDRIAIMNRGRIEQIGTYQHLYDDPVNRFVAGFLGTPSMNFLEGVLQGDQWTGQGITLSGLHAGSPHHPAILGIRPEHIQLGGDGPEAQVDRVDTLYDMRQQIVHFKLDHATLVAMVPLTTPIREKQVTRLTLPPESIYLFDPRTTERIRV